MTRAPCVLTPQHFGSLVFEHETSRYLPFDEATTAVLRDAVDEPIHARAEHDDGVRGLFHALEPRGYFTPDGRFAGDIREVCPPGDHLTGPLAVHLEVIGACNLSCSHCFADPLPRNRGLLTLTEMDTLFGDLSAMGTFRLGLTGGEPLMRRELLDIVDAATAHDLHPCLTTNGLLLDEEWARGLGRRELVWLNVSLDGATAATNDAVRGAGTFDAVVARLKALRGTLRFTLAFTVMRHNAHETDAFALLARELGAHTVVFRPLYPVGAARHKPRLMPEYSQYADALLRLGRPPNGEPRTLRGLDAFSPLSRFTDSGVVHAGAGCGAGNTIATISAKGDVNPCSFLGSGFDVANVRDQPFPQIWHDSPGFRAMRALSHAPAEGRFAGGCRARALAAQGDVDAADPWQAEFEAGGALPPSYTFSSTGTPG